MSQSNSRAMTTKNLGVIGALLILSGWVFACPWVIPDIMPPASWSFHAAGGLAVLLTVIAFLRSDDLAEYALIAIAVWLVIAPWVLGLSEIHTRQTISYGVVIAGIAWFGRASRFKANLDMPT